MIAVFHFVYFVFDSTVVISLGLLFLCKWLILGWIETLTIGVKMTSDQSPDCILIPSAKRSTGKDPNG